jgi:hypothetical protein
MILAATSNLAAGITRNPRIRLKPANDAVVLVAEDFAVDR